MWQGTCSLLIYNVAHVKKSVSTEEGDGYSANGVVLAWRPNCTPKSPAGQASAARMFTSAIRVHIYSYSRSRGVEVTERVLTFAVTRAHCPSLRVGPNLLMYLHRCYASFKFGISPLLRYI